MYYFTDMDFNLLKTFNKYIYSQDKLLISQDWENLLEVEVTFSSYSGSVFINEESKTIMMVHAGIGTGSTVTDTMYDISNWFVVYGENIPQQYENGCRYLVDSLLESMSISDLKEYNIITTGHGLGATLSDLSLLYMKQLGLSHASSYTIGNVGSFEVLHKLAKELEIPLSKDDTSQFIIFNTVDHIFADLHKQFGIINTVEYVNTCIAPRLYTVVNSSYELLKSSFSILKVSKDFFFAIGTLLPIGKFIGLASTELSVASTILSKIGILDTAVVILDKFMDGLYHVLDLSCKTWNAMKQDVSLIKVADFAYEYDQPDDNNVTSIFDYEISSSNLVILEVDYDWETHIV